jgi:hypothetical protein
MVEANYVQSNHIYQIFFFNHVERDMTWKEDIYKKMPSEAVFFLNKKKNSILWFKKKTLEIIFFILFLDCGDVLIWKIIFKK